MKLLLKINQNATHTENEPLTENGLYLKRGGGCCCTKEGGGGAAGCCIKEGNGPNHRYYAAAQVACGRVAHASAVTAHIRFTLPKPCGVRNGRAI
jgi:hypothetical protein